MPTIFFEKGYRFFFYSNENNEPIHVHIEKNDSVAKFWIQPIKLAKNLGENNIPSEIIIIGIVLKKIPYEFGENLSPKIAAAVPKAVEMTLNEIKNIVNYSSWGEIIYD